MQIVFHVGANFTDGDQLVRSLMLNTRRVKAQGIAIPGLSRYRKLIHETVLGLAGAQPEPGTRDVLLDAILDDPVQGAPPVTRLVMSNSSFICYPMRIFEAGRFYGLTAMKMRALSMMFPDDEIEIHMALRNPATFIPAGWESVPRVQFAQFMGGVDPRDMIWSEVIEQIRATLPRARLTIWCNEDTPLIWGEVMRRMMGVPEGTAIRGAFDVVRSIISDEGFIRFTAYLKTHPPKSEVQVRRVIAAFLDKYALKDAIEETVDLPGWDDALIDELTEEYEEDVVRIAAMPGVTFIAP